MSRRHSVTRGLLNLLLTRFKPGVNLKVLTQSEGVDKVRAGRLCRPWRVADNDALQA